MVLVHVFLEFEKFLPEMNNGNVMGKSVGGCIASYCDFQANPMLILTHGGFFAITCFSTYKRWVWKPLSCV